MAKSKPKLLVLDGQGVVFEAPIKRFLRAFAANNRISASAVVERWEKECRNLAWKGAIDDECLWNKLAGRKVDAQKTMQALASSYKPGPAADRLLRWSKKVPIWLFSNHRTHWIMPKLEALQLSGLFEKVLISDFTGVIKPDPESFLLLTSCGTAAPEILFVDDQLHNVEAARRIGVETILASPEQQWVEQIERALDG